MELTRADVVVFMIEKGIRPLPENAISLLCGTDSRFNEAELNSVISSIDRGLNKADRFTVISNLVRNNYIDTAILIVKGLDEPKYKRKLWSLILNESNRDALADRLVEANVECPSGGTALIRDSHDAYMAAWMTMARIFGLDSITNSYLRARITDRLKVRQHEPASYLCALGRRSRMTSSEPITRTRGRPTRDSQLFHPTKKTLNRRQSAAV